MSTQRRVPGHPSTIRQVTNGDFNVPQPDSLATQPGTCPVSALTRHKRGIEAFGTALQSEQTKYEAHDTAN
jgi:hypothetical protein